MCRWSAAGGRGGRGGASERASERRGGGREGAGCATERERDGEREREAKTRCLLGGPAGSRRTRAKERGRV